MQDRQDLIFPNPMVATRGHYNNCVERPAPWPGSVSHDVVSGSGGASAFAPYMDKKTANALAEEWLTGRFANQL